MTTRVLSGIAIAVVGVVLLCSGLLTALVFGGGAAASCTITASTAPGTTGPSAPHSPDPAGLGPIGRWDADQVGNAATIIAVGMRLGVPPRGWVIAVATAMQESILINLGGRGPQRSRLWACSSNDPPRAGAPRSSCTTRSTRPASSTTAADHRRLADHAADRSRAGSPEQCLS